MPYTTVPTTAPGAPGAGTATLSPDAGAALPPSQSLPDLCTVTRHTYADDGAGGQVSEETTLGPYACAILTEPKPMDRVLAGGVRVVVQARELYLEVGADVRPGDGLEHNGREYVVIDCTISTGDSLQKAYLEWLGQLAA